MFRRYPIDVPRDQEIESVPSEGYAPYFFPAEGAYLPFFFTEETFLKVLSALINGAAYTYQDEYMQVIWYFLQNVEFPVTFCEQMIVCLTNDEDVQAALRAFIVNDEAIQDGVERIAERGIPITETEAGTLIVDTDDLAALFGAITFLVDTMHNANLDLYEAVEASENKRELGAILFAAIPILETLPLNEVSEYFDKLKEAIAEGYNAQWTTTPITGLRDRIRCGLFCLALANDNSLSWDLIANYFWGEVGFTVGDFIDTMVDFVNFLNSGTWTGDEIVLISFANIASALSTAQKFADMTFPGLTTIMQLGLNDPDGDYETVCVDCVEPPTEICHDFPDGENGFVPYFNGFVYYATYETGVGYKPNYNPGIINVRKEDMGGTIIWAKLFFSENVPEGINNVVSAANYDFTGQTSVNDVVTAEVEIPGLSLSNGLMLDITFDGTLPSTFYLVGYCVEFETP